MKSAGSVSSTMDFNDRQRNSRNKKADSDKSVKLTGYTATTDQDPLWIMLTHSYAELLSHQATDRVRWSTCAFAAAAPPTSCWLTPSVSSKCPVGEQRGGPVQSAGPGPKASGRWPFPGNSASLDPPFLLDSETPSETRMVYVSETPHLRTTTHQLMGGDRSAVFHQVLKFHHQWRRGEQDWSHPNWWTQLHITVTHYIQFSFLLNLGVRLFPSLFPFDF